MVCKRNEVDFCSAAGGTGDDLHAAAGIQTEDAKQFPACTDFLHHVGGEGHAQGVTDTVRQQSADTGGGFDENIPRMLPEGIRAVVKKDSYEVPAIFKLLQKTGDITDQMMYNTYNMGLGMILALDPADVEKAMEAMKAAGEDAYIVGKVEAGEKGVPLC